MATWLVQSNLLDPERMGKICNALRERSIPYHGCTVIPFDDEIDCFWGSDGEPDTNKIIPYGSSKLARLALTKNWSGMFFDLQQFRVDTWIANRDDMLNHDAEITTVGDLKKRFENVKDDEKYFIRPCEDLKAFNGVVTTAKELRRWRDSDDSQNFSFRDYTLCAVSSPKIILMEWRWFIVNRKIISGSTYKAHDQRYVQREDDVKVIAEAQTFADKWLPHDNCVMDIALTSAGPKVIEYNCLNSSGFYYHDIGAVIQAVTDYVDSRG